MANKIREFSLRVQEALQRHAILYSSDLGGIANTSAGHPTLCRKRADGVRHVGLDAAINKVQEWLADGEKKLKVVSIVGVGGVGKTTLANELYRKLGRQFECQAFVRSSQKVDMRRLLISMLSQVRLQQPPDNWKLHSLISSIRTHLQDKSISFDLTEISELVRLRYLKVTSNITLKMPTHMQGLQYLEALKIDGKIDAVPSDIVHLPGLLHLSLPARTNPPNGIAHMSSLRTLGYIDLSCNTSENLWSLGELTNLQDLQLTYSAIHSDNLKNNMQYLGSILGKLPNLKSITLSPVGSSYANTLHIHSATSTSVSVYGWSSVSSPPALLQRLELLPCVCIFSSLPNWIGQLGNLCILMIGIREVTSYDVDVLGGLPALTVLSLYVHTKPAESIVFDNARFSVLKYLKFRCSLAWMKFEAGAMPNLRKLKLGFDVHRADQHDAIPVGIENLSGLEEITAKIKVDFTAGDLCRRFAESALTDAIRMHPGRPIVNIRCVDWTFDDKDNNNVRTRDEEHRTTEKQHLIVKEGLNEKSVVLQKDHGEGACKSVEGERRGVLTAGSWWRRQPQFERFYKSAESRADDGGGGGSIISGAQTVPIKNFTGGWPAPPWEEGSGTTMPPVYINEGEYINVIYYSPPRSSTTTSSQDESTEASERERSGSGTGSSEGGFYGPTFQAVGRYLDRKFGLDRED
ncbi:Os05g0479700 [Oryza sativa Japonica Group]|uniref:Os05g0479700 protein n=1 Tax=Oryza sativa subsp. japonica TaxID=39947 RepID=A0A0P0WNK6_ORYSJ|nr:hypothetical protein EE612_030209 [Oryza sativa]BAS94562.1 Os05g0479700 [Oryza sativa Japonica Group]